MGARFALLCGLGIKTSCEGGSLLSGLLVFVAGLAVSASEVQVSTLDGATIAGKIQQITSDQIVAIVGAAQTQIRVKRPSQGYHDDR